MKTINIKKSAAKLLARAANDAPRIRKTLDRYAETGHGDVAPVIGQPGIYRMRVGAWRIFFTEAVDQITVQLIEKRGDAYRR
ncbi:MAG: type II toxin-antitoxin system RelE/ParE family toxin [Pseudomonadota bacterium]